MRLSTKPKIIRVRERYYFNGTVFTDSMGQPGREPHVACKKRFRVDVCRSLVGVTYPQGTNSGASSHGGLNQRHENELADVTSQVRYLSQRDKAKVLFDCQIMGKYLVNEISPSVVVI